MKADIKLNAEFKKVVGKVRSAQEKFQALLKNQDWVDEARQYAERQGQEVKKLLSADVDKVKAFIEKERKELERFQKEIPGEVKKLKNLIQGQRKELEKLLATVRKTGAKSKPRKKAGGTKKSGTPRKKSAANA